MEKMTVFEAASIMETQAMQLVRARAVLMEVDHYFEDIENRKNLPHYAEHIQQLLHVADHLLFEAVPDLQKSADGLYETNKAKKAVTA